MGLSTCGELKAAIADWLDRPDLEARIPDLMALARSRIHHGRGRGHAWPSAPLRLRAMEAEAPLDATGGREIHAPLPEGFLGAVRLLAGGAAEAPARPFAYLPPDAYHARPGRSEIYTVEGDRLRAAAVSEARLTLRYWRAFPALVEDGDSDWLLANAPGVHLYAALLEAMPYLRADQRLPLWAALYAGAVDGCMASDRMAAAPAGLRLRVAGATP